MILAYNDLIVILNHLFSNLIVMLLFYFKLWGMRVVLRLVTKWYWCLLIHQLLLRGGILLLGVSAGIIIIEEAVLLVKSHLSLGYLMVTMALTSNLNLLSYHLKALLSTAFGLIHCRNPRPQVIHFSYRENPFTCDFRFHASEPVKLSWLAEERCGYVCFIDGICFFCCLARLCISLDHISVSCGRSIFPKKLFHGYSLRAGKPSFFHH